MFHILLWRD